MKRILPALRRCLMVACWAVCSLGWAAPELVTENPTYSEMALRLASLKTGALRLDEELQRLEDDAFIPAHAQLVVFVSLTAKQIPEFESLQVQVRIDGRELSRYSYTAREIGALYQGGFHRLFLGALPAGRHEISAVVEGQPVNGGPGQVRAAFDLNDGRGQKVLQLGMRLDVKGERPALSLSEWHP